MGRIMGCGPSSPTIEFPSASRKRLQGTPQQVAFWDAVTEGAKNVVLRARAGTGKSTSCREAIWRIAEQDPLARCVYVAFNKSIAAEFQSGLPLQAAASTMHSAGFKACRDALRLSGGPDKHKLYGIVSTRVKRGDNAARSIKAAVVRLVNLCKTSLIDGTDRLAVQRLAIQYGVNLKAEATRILDLVPWVLQQSRERLSTVDFTDMVWLPVVLGLPFDPCDWLFVDEAQDLDSLQHEFVRLMAGSSPTIVVGDDRQAIYLFRGADSRSLASLSARLDRTDRGVESLPLTLTRRCPKSHVDLASAIVPDFEAMPEAPEGTIEENATDDVFRPGAMVLCRLNAPLVSLCYYLISRQIPVAIQGKDIGEGLVNLIESFDCSTLATLCRSAEEYRARELERLEELDGSEEDIASLNDRIGCILSISAGCQNTGEVIDKIDSMFVDVSKSEQGSYCLLSSVHRAKGRESDSVVIYRPEKLILRTKSAEATLQEYNLAYVAATRSRDYLAFHNGPIPACFS